MSDFGAGRGAAARVAGPPSPRELRRATPGRSGADVCSMGGRLTLSACSLGSPFLATLFSSAPNAAAPPTLACDVPPRPARRHGRPACALDRPGLADRPHVGSDVTTAGVTRYAPVRSRLAPCGHRKRRGEPITIGVPGSQGGGTRPHVPKHRRVCTAAPGDKVTAAARPFGRDRGGVPAARRCGRPGSTWAAWPLRRTLARDDHRRTQPTGPEAKRVFRVITFCSETGEAC